MKSIDMQAYRASTGRNLDKDDVFINPDTEKSSSLRGNSKSNRVHARDKIRKHRSMGKKQIASTKQSYSQNRKKIAKSPMTGTSRSPLRLMSVNSPQSYEYQSTDSTKQEKTASPKQFSPLQQRSDGEMKSILKSAAMKLQPRVSLSMSPLHATSIPGPSPLHEKIDAGRHDRPKNRIIQSISDGFNVIGSQPGDCIDDYEILMRELSQEQSLRYKEVSNKNQSLQHYTVII
jgi:hypothetical protein